jgi:hypothetical protein
MYRESQKDHELQRGCELNRQRHAALHPNEDKDQNHRKPLPAGTAQPIQTVGKPKEIQRLYGNLADVASASPKAGNREESRDKQFKKKSLVIHCFLLWALFSDQSV